MKEHNRQRGVSLVEALVALVVVSVGMLGIASLYVASLRAGRTALVRTQAVNLVNDMADRIRSNPRGRGAYATSGYANKPGGPALGSCVANSDPKTNCTAQQLAEDDLARWLTAVKGALPGTPTANVEYTKGRSNGFPDTYRIQVMWSEPIESQAPNAPPPQFSYQSNLELIAVVP